MMYTILVKKGGAIIMCKLNIIKNIEKINNSELIALSLTI